MASQLQAQFRETVEKAIGIENALKNGSPRLFGIYEKIRRIEELPAKEECKLLMNSVDSSFGASSYTSLMVKNGYYQIVHKELISDLKKLVNRLDPKSSVEPCAGVGKLSYHLNESGIDITATDSGKIVKSDHAIQLTHLQTLRIFNPELVIVAFPPDSSVVFDSLRHESVKWVLVLRKGRQILELNKKEVKQSSVRTEAVEIDIYPSAVDSLDNHQKINGKPMVDIDPNKEERIRNFYLNVLFYSKRAEN
ncbi:MAG: hypothetical protein KGH71_00505 [Candidatus Micrarchaeota archaeon]|nr:hypothetical protein [Candidatus Micrarchaeota archaeon]